MRITVAKSGDLEGLYVDGILAKQAEFIDVDDIMISAGKERIVITNKYVDEDWLRLNYHTFPLFEINIVELDS